MVSDADKAEIARDLAEIYASQEKKRNAVVRAYAAIRGAITGGTVRGGKVLPHVQRAVNFLADVLGLRDFGTYPGHSPTSDRGVDVFHKVHDITTADKITSYSIENAKRDGLRYTISYQQIWHRLDPVWRWMEDRGSDTQNHKDHVHNAYEVEVAEPVPEPTPKPTPPIIGDVMSLSVRYVWGPKGQVGKTDWVFDGPSRVFATGMTADVLRACDESGVMVLGHVDDATHKWFESVAGQWGK